MKINKKNLIYLIYLPIIFNFLLNFVTRKNLINFNFYDLFASLLLFVFLYLIGSQIKILFDLPYISTGIVIYLLFTYLLESLILFFNTTLTTGMIILTSNSLWILFLFAFKKVNFKLLTGSILNYSILNLFTEFSFEKLSSNLNIIGDVKDIHFKHVSNIYKNNLYVSMNDPSLEGYPQLVAYSQALVTKISTNLEEFYYFSFTTNIIYFLFLLIFIELNISNESKIMIVVVFTSLIYNSEWLKFLFIESLMTEGVLSYLFFILIVSYLFLDGSKKIPIAAILTSFGIMYLSKQFISTLALLVVLISFFKLHTRKFAFFGLIGLIIKELSYLSYFKNLEKNYHLRDVDLIDTLFDLLLFRDLKFVNIPEIILNLFIDIPLTILLLTHLLLTLIYYFRFHTRESSINYLTALIILNYILITALYLTLWKNMELETPIRYILNLLPLIVFTQFKIIDQIRINY